MSFKQTLLAAALAAFLAPALAAEFETSLTLDAIKVLPKDLLSGPNHQLDKNVTHAGFLNHYTINTPKGEVTAVSTATLRNYIPEINAAARMEQVRGSKEFMAGITEKAGGVVEGTKDLVTDPVDKIGGAVSGVGELFGRAKENIVGGSRRDAETSRMKDLLGYAKTRRDYAHQFRADAYTRNPILKSALDDISWAGFSGNLTATAVLMAVPGGAGVAVTVAGSSKLALAAMPNTKGRDAYVKFAVLSNDPDVAFFRQRQAQMYERMPSPCWPGHRDVRLTMEVPRIVSGTAVPHGDRMS